MSFLITSDLHFTDAPKDDYRWELFPWLKKQVAKHRPKYVLLLGDLTDHKDKHSAQLVNRLVRELSELSELVKVIILKGNHDFVSETTPFFGFVGLLKDRVRFIIEPWHHRLDGKPCLFLPSTRNYKEAWKDIDFTPYDYIFTHQTFDGALAENGIDLRGIPPSIFKGLKAQVISGDIHVPQRIGRNITYVGSPYRVHFGDDFQPRVLLLEGGEFTDLHVGGVSRELLVGRNISDINAKSFPARTQVKVRIRLKRSEYPEWPELKRKVQALVAERGWELCGLELQAMKVKPSRITDDPEAQIASAEEALMQHAKIKKLDKTMTAQGMEFLKEAQQ